MQRVTLRAPHRFWRAQLQHLAPRAHNTPAKLYYYCSNHNDTIDSYWRSPNPYSDRILTSTSRQIKKKVESVIPILSFPSQLINGTGQAGRIRFARAANYEY